MMTEGRRRDMAMRCCGTCTRKSGQHKCHALNEFVGEFEECWAWSDDINWKVKLERDIAKYTRIVGKRWRG